GERGLSGLGIPALQSSPVQPRGLEEALAIGTEKQPAELNPVRAEDGVLRAAGHGVPHPHVAVAGAGDVPAVGAERDPGEEVPVPGEHEEPTVRREVPHLNLPLVATTLQTAGRHVGKAGAVRAEGRGVAAPGFLTGEDFPACPNLPHFYFPRPATD